MEWFDPSIPRPPGEQLRVSALVDETATAALFERAPRSLQAVMKEARTRGIFLIAGNAATPDGKTVREINERWSQPHLHQPSDDLNQPFDYGHMVQWAELFRRWTERAANADERPFWYEGDYFGQRFAPGARKVDR